MKKRILTVLSLLTLSLSPLFSHADYSRHPSAYQVALELSKEANIDTSYTLGLLQQVSKNERVIELMGPKKKKKKKSTERYIWQNYHDIFLSSDALVHQAVDFQQEYSSTLRKAEAQFGVPQSIILGILGIETRYGRITGSFSVLEALATLAFDYPRRSEFFTKELKTFIQLSHQGHFDPREAKGSYAGAMGLGQFMPSSYLNYAIDFNGDGKKDLFNPVDAIGSIANYFKAHGWKTGEPVASRAVAMNFSQDDMLNNGLKPKYTLQQTREAGLKPIQCYQQNLDPLYPCKPKGFEPEQVLPVMLEWDYGKEYWLGFQNFYAITRYNHSRWYAMAVYHLSENIRLAR